MGTSPKSSVFATVGSRTSTQQRGSATGYYNGDHNREAQRGKQNGKQQRKVKKMQVFFHLLNCFKINSVCKSKGKMKITYFFELFLWRWAQVLSHQFSQRLARGLRPNNGVVQRGNTTGTTIGKHNGGNKTGNSSEKWKKMQVFLGIFYLLNCFKIMSVCKSKEKMKITDFLNYFFEDGHKS